MHLLGRHLWTKASNGTTAVRPRYLLNSEPLFIYNTNGSSPIWNGEAEKQGRATVYCKSCGSTLLGNADGVVGCMRLLRIGLVLG